MAVTRKTLKSKYLFKELQPDTKTLFLKVKGDTIYVVGNYMWTQFIGFIANLDFLSRKEFEAVLAKIKKSCIKKHKQKLMEGYE